MAAPDVHKGVSLLPLLPAQNRTLAALPSINLCSCSAVGLFWQQQHKKSPRTLPAP